MKSKISKIALVNIELTMSEDEVLKLQKAIKKSKRMKICLFHKKEPYMSIFDFGTGKLKV